MKTEQYIHININGSKRTYKDHDMKILHCKNGPAIEWPDGNKIWYLNGILHRADGPAIEWSDGTKEWYLNGKELSQEQFNPLIHNMETLYELKIN